MKESSDTYANLIGGEWISGEKTRDNLNPSDIRDVIGHYASAETDAMDDAVSAARSAFPAWAAASPQIRHDLLDAVGNELLSRKDEIGRLLAREEGKALAEGIGETTRAGQVFKFFAGDGSRVCRRRTSDQPPGNRCDIFHRFGQYRGTDSRDLRKSAP